MAATMGLGDFSSFSNIFCPASDNCETSRALAHASIMLGGGTDTMQGSRQRRKGLTPPGY